MQDTLMCPSKASIEKNRYPFSETCMLLLLLLGVV